MKALTVTTGQRQEFKEITSLVEGVIQQSRIQNGVCVLFCRHTTAALTINENADPAVLKDMSLYLNRAVAADPEYLHQEGNSDAHIKSSLFGCSLTVLVENGRLALGRWQGIYFCEFDGPRTRQIDLRIMEG